MTTQLSNMELRSLGAAPDVTRAIFFRASKNSGALLVSNGLHRRGTAGRNMPEIRAGRQPCTSDHRERDTPPLGSAGLDVSKGKDRAACYHFCYPIRRHSVGQAGIAERAA
jgi:hypothetical protein